MRMRITALWLVLFVVGGSVVMQGQGLFEYKEERVSGRVIAYRLLVDFPPGVSIGVPPPDVLLLRVDADSAISKDPKFVLVAMRNMLDNGFDLKNVGRQEFLVQRWVGCDEVGSKRTMKLIKPVKRKEFPEGKLIPCYYAAN